MIKEALEYIVGLNEANVQDINGDTYSDKKLHRIDAHYPKASPICISTLTGLVDYINAEIDDMPEKMIIEVASPTTVKLYSMLDGNREREYLAEVNACLPEFEFNRFILQERFCINMQAKFIDTPDKNLLLRFAGTVEAGTVATYGDDGVSQKATVKTGLASKGEAIIPSPAKLQPYRTFLEVDQPISAFIFRMQDKNNGVECAIFEADGGAWRIEAMQSIMNYLIMELLDKPQFTVIA